MFGNISSDSTNVGEGLAEVDCAIQGWGDAGGRRKCKSAAMSPNMGFQDTVYGVRIDSSKSTAVD